MQLTATDRRTLEQIRQRTVEYGRACEGEIHRLRIEGRPSDRDILTSLELVRHTAARLVERIDRALAMGEGE